MERDGYLRKKAVNGAWHILGRPEGITIGTQCALFVCYFRQPSPVVRCPEVVGGPVDSTQEMSMDRTFHLARDALVIVPSAESWIRVGLGFEVPTLCTHHEVGRGEHITGFYGIM